MLPRSSHCFFFFFFNDTATTEIYTLSLHDALPIYIPERHIQDKPKARGQRFEEPDVRHRARQLDMAHPFPSDFRQGDLDPALLDRKSTRLNSSHLVISYAVFCLKKKIIPETAR